MMQMDKVQKAEVEFSRIEEKLKSIEALMVATEQVHRWLASNPSRTCVMRGDSLALKMLRDWHVEISRGVRQARAIAADNHDFEELPF